jgi:glycosyltransferase involved in cell wall biosynthesis
MKFMTTDMPRVTIGLPVYNGENYLAESIESILAQTFTDFELIIADNASTDKTAEICQAYAEKDSRIRYIRNKENLGASPNYNLLVSLARGEYFKWQAHDDLSAPEFIERCVAILDADSEVVVCYSRTRAVDGKSEIVSELDVKYRPKPELNDKRPHVRFFECVCVHHSQVAVFGLMRTNVLKKTRLIEGYSSSDRTLLGELSLRGRMYEIPEVLLFKRHHDQQHWRVYPTRRARQIWYDPNRTGKLTFPHWRLMIEHFRSIMRTQISLVERFWCGLYMGWWMRVHWRLLSRNLLLKG